MGNVLYLIFLAALWSPSFLFIKYGLEGFPPVTLAMLRLAVAAAASWGALRLSGHVLPRAASWWRPFLLMGLFGNAIPFALFCAGETQAESGMAAILNSTTPIFTVLLAHMFLHDERLTASRLAGILLGFAGILTLFWPELRGGFLLSGRFWGFGAFAIAALCYGISTVYARQVLRDVPARISSTAQLICAAALLVPVSFVFERPFASAVSVRSVGAVLWLALVGTALAYALYYDLLRRTNATFVSMVTYIIPPGGIALGALFLGEELHWTALGGCALILLGVVVVSGVFRRGWRRLAAWKSARESS